MTKQTKAFLALVFICIVWGTTYLAIRIGVMHYPAFLFAGVRQFAAGILLIPIALILNKQTDLSRSNILRQMLMGFLMLTLGNGGVTWAEKYIESGVAALLCSMMLLFAVMFNLMSSKRDHFNATIGFGLLVGIIGVGLIFKNNIADLANPEYLGGILCIFIGTAGWALGSTMNKGTAKSVNPLFNSGMQLLFGGIFMLALSPLVDDYTNLQLWNTNGLLSLAYLIIFGSVLAYAAYMYVLNVLPVGIATIYAYINPLIAVIAGYIFLNEALNIYIALAFVAIVVSVYLVNMGYKRQQKIAEQLRESKIAGAFPKNAPVES